jgi:D-sedoheptulose 7-phosphate isomerase
VAADLIFAQQVYGYGRPGDVLLAISTSGSSANVVHALRVAKLKEMKTIGLMGQGSGEMEDLCDAAIKVPYSSTPDIQQRHVAVYHTLCALLEQHFFGA